MADLVAPPDVEGLAIAYLTAATGEQVSTIYPREGVNRAVRVTTTGGTVTGRVIASPRVLIECWDTSTARASRLASDVHAHLVAWPDVYRVHAELPVSNQDVNRMDLQRYQFLATVWLRMRHVD